MCIRDRLVNVTPADFPSAHPLAGMAWQRQLEEAAYALTGGYNAPCQRVEDFLAGRPSAGPGLVRPTYRPGVVYTDLHRCLPPFVCEDVYKRQGQGHGRRVHPGRPPH